MQTGYMARASAMSGVKTSLLKQNDQTTIIIYVTDISGRDVQAKVLIYLWRGADPNPNMSCIVH